MLWCQRAAGSRMLLIRGEREEQKTLAGGQSATASSRAASTSRRSNDVLGARAFWPRGGRYASLLFCSSPVSSGTSRSLMLALCRCRLESAMLGHWTAARKSGVDDVQHLEAAATRLHSTPLPTTSCPRRRWLVACLDWTKEVQGQSYSCWRHEARP